MLYLITTIESVVIVLMYRDASVAPVVMERRRGSLSRQLDHKKLLSLTFRLNAISSSTRQDVED